MKSCYISKESFEKICSQGKQEDMERLIEFQLIEFEKTKKQKGIIKILNEYVEAYNPNIEEEKIDYEGENPYVIFGVEGQVKQFIKKQPFFFDKSGMYWLWNKQKTKWEMVDKTDILNSIKKQIGVDVINPKKRAEIIYALQGEGRFHIPKEIPKDYVQFKNKIINVKTGEEFEATPKYFSTNSIPWEIGESEETKILDKYFIEWVGEEFKQTLYEIIAYSMCSDQFMQRIMALVGGGSNGKGTFIKIIKKFLGKENVATSELSLLASNQFETSTIYKKLLCEMGEVSYDDLKFTNQIKKLSGEDDIRYCFKGKTPFTERSPTTCIINTNSLPSSRDKTVGFYRRWLIIDFPHQFEIKHGILESISDEVFKNLAKKSINLLKKLYEGQKFSNEGTYEERSEKYETRSNPLMQFVKKYCVERLDIYISLKNFSKKLNEYLIKNHLRLLNTREIKKILGEEGFLVRQSTRNGVQDVYISNLRTKYEENSGFLGNKGKNELIFG